MGHAKNFSIEEYLLFLLLYASHVDYKFSSDEKQHLKHKYAVKYPHVEVKFNALNEAERILVLTDGLVKFRDEPKLEDVKELLMEQFYLDGKYCKYERSFLKYFSQLQAAV